MRANDYLKTIEPNCGFYEILKKIIYEFAYYRNDKEGTERVYNFNLLQDKTRKKYLDELKMWELLEQDESHKPTYYENTFGITHDIASHIRDLLFSAIENDKSFGYLFYLLASEKNRTEIFYQNNPIDCIPDKKLIEETIYNYQDDYPKKSLEEFLTYCDLNYLFYKKYKTDSHTNDYWFSIFYKSYSIFEDVRTQLFYPFSAFEFIKELDFDDENMKLYCITLVSQLLEHYNYDLNNEQARGKKILVDEIQNNLDLLKAGKIPADPLVRSIGWLSEHPELMTYQEQQDMNNSLKAIKVFGNNIKYKFPSFELVKSIIDETPDIDEKIILLEDVIATWEVNMQIAIKHKNDITAQKIGEKRISLFNDLLLYLKKMKKLQDDDSIINQKRQNKQIEIDSPPLNIETDEFEVTNNITAITNSINNAFFKLESFMKGTTSYYNHFEFDNAFSNLFVEAKKNENYNFEICNLLSQYWTLCSQIAHDFDKSEFDNDLAYKNDDFCKDCNEIENLYWNRMEEFECFFPKSISEQSERKFSITHILQDSEISHKQLEQKSTKTNQPILLDFLNNNSDLSLLVEIQNAFKHYEGKRLAILIFLLQTERKIINIIPKSRTHSRKHFVRLFKEDYQFDKMFAVDKYIDSYYNNLNLPTTNENDADYVDVKEKLNKIIET